MLSKTLYCIGRVIEIREGYPFSKDETKPRILKLSMEPNPYSPSFTMEIGLGRGLHEGVEVGDRIKITMAHATNEEWESFQAKVSQPQAIAS